MKKSKKNFKKRNKSEVMSHFSRTKSKKNLKSNSPILQKEANKITVQF